MRNPTAYLCILLLSHFIILLRQLNATMVNPSSPQHNKGSGSDTSADARSNAEAELLQSVLAADAYPWQIEDAANYEAEAESAGQALEISDEDASNGWQALSAQLNQMWAEDATQSAFQQRFAGRLPADLLAQIAQKAQQISANGESMVNQMVVCAQEALSGITDADLQVMARPMAMAMRGRSSDEIVEVTVKSVRDAAWDTLSPVEQAKLSLAAAKYALSEASGSN